MTEKSSIFGNFLKIEQFTDIHKNKTRCWTRDLMLYFDVLPMLTMGWNHHDVATYCNKNKRRGVLKALDFYEGINIGIFVFRLLLSCGKESNIMQSFEIQEQMIVWFFLMWTLPLASPEHCRHKLSVLCRIKKIHLFAGW